VLSTQLTVSGNNGGESHASGSNCSHTSDSPTADIRQTLSGNGVVHMRNFIEPAEILAIKSKLDNLFANFNHLPPQVSPKADSNRDIREIANLINYFPLLRQSPPYRKCHRLASDIFGAPARYGFDHAIYKAPNSDSVKWHQDQFYSKFDRDKQCVSFWIPLQAVAPLNGGMQYAVTSDNSTPPALLSHTRVSPKSHMYHVPPELLSRLETISPEMQAGDVCLHTPLTPHRSHPNGSADIRGAWILQFNKFGPLRFVRWGNIRNQLKHLISAR